MRTDIFIGAAGLRIANDQPGNVPRKFSRAARGDDRTAPVRNNWSPKIRALRNWRMLLPARDREELRRERRTKASGGPTDERRRWNQYVAHLLPFSLSLSIPSVPTLCSPSFSLSHILSSFSLSHFLRPSVCLSLPFFPLLNPPTKPLLLVSDFYLVAPGPRFISRSPLSFSLGLFSLSFLSPSLSVSLSLSLSLAIAYQQPAASNSPELLIPDFRPVGKSLTPFLLVLLFLLLFLWPRRSPAAPPPGPSYQG